MAELHPRCVALDDLDAEAANAKIGVEQQRVIDGGQAGHELDRLGVISCAANSAVARRCSSFTSTRYNAFVRARSRPSSTGSGTRRCSRR
jgi:hypothetical protein